MSEFRSGNGSAWLDLLTTLRHRYRDDSSDDLRTPERLRAWLASVGLEPIGEVDERDRAAVIETREALHRVTSATVRGAAPDPSDVETVTRALAYDNPPPLELGATGLRAGRPATAKEALGRLVRDAITLLTSEDVRLLRFCGDDTCSGIFVDHTGRRKWCLDLSCGNRSRVRAHRARASRS